MTNEFLSVSEAAGQLSVSEQYIRSLLRNKRISSQKVGRSWIIPSDAIAQFVSEGALDLVLDHPRTCGKRRKLKALSFFSGAMGLDLGLEAEGIHVLLASEIAPVTRQTIHANRPDIALIGDIEQYSAKEIRRFAGLSNDEEIELIVGGPPCQAFSTAGRRNGFNDHRGNVFLTFIERILELRPRFAVIENVRGLLSAPLKHRPHEGRGFGFPPLTPEEEKGGALAFIINKLEQVGYGISFNLYNAANYGAPQKRERVIIVCSRDGEKLPYLTPTHSESGGFGLPRWRTVREALHGLEAVKHNYVKFPEKRLRFYRQLKPGQYWKHLPEHLQKQALGAAFFAGGGKTGFLRRLPWDEPSPTLVTHPAMPATDLAHPVEDRPLSVQEYKRLQEFPDDWRISGTVLDQYRQIGNAVPLSLGRAIARLILDHMTRKKPKGFPHFPYSRYRNTDDVSWRNESMKKADAAEPQLELPLHAA